MLWRHSAKEINFDIPQEDFTEEEVFGFKGLAGLHLVESQ